MFYAYKLFCNDYSVPSMLGTFLLRLPFLFSFQILNICFKIFIKNLKFFTRSSSKQTLDTYHDKWDVCFCSTSSLHATHTTILQPIIVCLLQEDALDRFCFSCFCLRKNDGGERWKWIMNKSLLSLINFRKFSSWKSFSRNIFKDTFLF